MEGLTIGIYVARALQILFSLVLLGCAANVLSAINGDFYDNDNRDTGSLGFGTFAGVFGFVFSVVGLAAMFIASTALAWVTMVADILSSIFYFAAFIDIAVIYNMDFKGRDGICWYLDASGFCNDIPAAAAFAFLAFVAVVACRIMLRMYHARHATSTDAAATAA